MKKEEKKKERQQRTRIHHLTLFNFNERIKIRSNGLMADKVKWFKPGIKAYTKEELVIAQKPEIG